MGAKCGKVTCCGLWVQRSNPGCYSLFEQSSGVGSREARLPLIKGWQLRDKRLTAYTLLFLLFLFGIITCCFVIFENCFHNGHNHQGEKASDLLHLLLRTLQA